MVVLLEQAIHRDLLGHTPNMQYLEPYCNCITTLHYKNDPLVVVLEEDQCMDHLPIAVSQHPVS